MTAVNRFDALVSTKTCRRVLGLNRQDMSEIIERGELAAFVIGGKRLVRAADLTLFICRLTRAGVNDAAV